MKHVVLLKQERETKRTIRYHEDSGDEKEIVGTIYLQKTAVDLLGNPKSIKVTIEAV